MKDSSFSKPTYMGKDKASGSYEFSLEKSAKQVYGDSIFCIMSHSMQAVIACFWSYRLRLMIKVKPDVTNNLGANSSKIYSALSDQLRTSCGELIVSAEILIHKDATPELARVAVSHELAHLLMHLEFYCKKRDEYKARLDEEYIDYDASSKERFMNARIDKDVKLNNVFFWPTPEEKCDLYKDESSCNKLARELCFLHDKFNKSDEHAHYNKFPDDFFDKAISADLNDALWHPSMHLDSKRRFYEPHKPWVS